MSSQSRPPVPQLIRAVASAIWQDSTAGLEHRPERLRVPSRSPSRFHYLMIGLIILLQIGGVIDARMHVFSGFDIDSFFVPAHYLMYGAWFAILTSIVIHISLQIRKGNTNEFLPPGYAFAAAGAILFGAAGGLDALWHTLFGFELNLEVLLSPSHLVLFVAFGLIYFSVLSHAAHEFNSSPERHQGSFLASLPLSIGVASLFVIVFWPTWYFDPLAADYASGGAIVGERSAYSFIDYGSPTAEIAGVGGILLTTLILVPFAILPLHRWRLPPGSLTFTFAWVFLQRALILGVYIYLPAVLGAALVGETIWLWMRRRGETALASPRGYRAIAFSLTFTLLSIYFLAVALAPRGIIWPPHIWAGSIFMAALAGAVLAYLLIPGVANKA